MKKRTILTRLVRWTALLALAAVVLILGVNFAVILSTEQSIVEANTALTEAVDCILVLGCGVRADGSPSDMLYDRVKTACGLYLEGYAEKILMSGDHGRDGYDEVNVMKRVAIEEFGIPSEDVFMDHAGFSTYETMARAVSIFGIKRAIIVTQEYHLSRALYLARAYGIEAVGVSASLRTYRGQALRDLREAAARCKDFVTAIAKPAYVGGEPIDITGDGNITND